MRLLVVTTSYPGLAHSASGIFVQRMLRQLPDDIRVSVVAPASDQPAQQAVEVDRIRLHSFRYAPRRFQTLAHRPGGIPVALMRQPLQWLQVPIFYTSMMVATWRWACHADVIHANWLISGIAAGVVGRLLQVPVVTTLRGADMDWAAKSMVCRWLLKWTLRLSRRVVVVSQAMADQLIGWFGPLGYAVQVIANGVESIDPVVGSPGDAGFEVVVVGSLIPRKQVDRVIQAVADSAEIIPGIRLRIVGDGPQKASLQALSVRMGIGRRVLFAGQVAPEQVAGHLLKCQALVLASTSEGRPNAVLEAMAVGIPVVASDIDGVREMITPGGTGLIFPVGDANQLADHLKSLWMNPELGRLLAANAKQWVADQGLTWERTAARYAGLFHQLSSQNPHRKR